MSRQPQEESALVKFSVKQTLFRMAFPMLAGTFAMNAYHFTDTWFVSRLGTNPLAAMGFSFPVIMLLRCVAGGIGNGVSTLAAHALGRQAHADAARIVTHGIALMLMVAGMIAIGGYCSIDAIFSRLGADEQIMPLVTGYMRTWYLGAAFMALPMLGNGLLIASGDSRRAARLMLLGPILNTIFDPILIFGFWVVPAMGIRGAALATVLAQAVTTVCLCHLLLVKYRLLTWKRWPVRDWLNSLRRIMAFSIPNILSMMLMPIAATVITRLLGGFGNEAVAGSSAAGRLESFAFIIPMALGISLTPFVSQNYGAGRLDRIHEALRLSLGFALIYGAAVTVLFFIFAPWLALIFSRDPRVVEVMVSYIRIVGFGYGMMESHRYCSFFLTGVHRPGVAALLNAVRVLILLIPMVCLGARLGGVSGVFWGRLTSDLTAGFIGICWVRWILSRLKMSTTDAERVS
ncbi:MAG: MATE family efflux transporter [Kiritimatiellia bacterium]|jgi:putative MATE family efflux protein